MNAMVRTALVAVAALVATQAAAQVTFYENEGFGGRSFTTQQRVGDFARYGFNDRASSAVVAGNRWEICEGARFEGRCVVLRPGRYPSLAAMGLNDRVSSVRTVNANARIDDSRYAPLAQAARITFYENEGYAGRSFTTQRAVANFQNFGFNDRASSVEVFGERWEICENARFGGRCVVLRPGRYASVAAMGLNNRISSVRTVRGNARIEDHRYAPGQVADRGYQRRGGERLYEANVTSVRAVVGAPEQRCWIEAEQVVVQERGTANSPDTIVGAIIGGILGHQAGTQQEVRTQNVQRCASVPSQARPDHWDVTYTFRGQDHRMQMSTRPGRTVTVNEQGEPRA